LGALVIYPYGVQTQHADVTKVREMWGLHGIAQTLDEDESK